MEQKNFQIIRILLIFRENPEERNNVAKIARILGVEIYTASRLLIQMEGEGLINRENNRWPRLTAKGKKQADFYADRIEVLQEHLVYEGVDQFTAGNDAFYWSVFSSDETLDVIRRVRERYRIRYEFRDQKSFSGTALCKKLHDGNYQFPFLIYREKVVNGNNLSMANEGFRHPCTLQVKDGTGKIYVQPVEMQAHSRLTNDMMKGHVSSLKYFDSGHFIPAERQGTNLLFSADSIHFQSIGTGAEQILHGTIPVRMTCSVGLDHMPEADAIFTLLI